MTFTVYSKPGCGHCKKVQEVLELAEQRHVVYTLNKEFSGDDFKNEFGQGATFPQVLVNDRHLGGCLETIKYLKEQNLV